jgi:membrane protease YdiL (CAAX protease family)
MTSDRTTPDRTTPDLFYNHANRLRSVWRLAIFVVAYLAVFTTLLLVVRFALAMLLPEDASEWVLESSLGWIIQAVVILSAANIVGWACNYALEDLPPRALGWTLHRGWLRDLLAGSLGGALSVGLAVGVCAATGAYQFALTPTVIWPAVLKTVVISGVIFLLGAASEEALFRGYPLQTLMRSWPLWIALLPTSVPFAVVHLNNPNVAPVFTFANTVLAGVWLAVAYARTRSLWFPLGLHWTWNWMMGALYGIPVSGIKAITPEPLLRSTEAGADWFTGGAYGIEGGAACTLALVVSTLIIWRTRWPDATEELRRMTDAENPDAGADSVVPHEATATRAPHETTGDIATGETMSPLKETTGDS